MDDERKYKTINISWMHHEMILRYATKVFLETGYKMPIREIAEMALRHFLRAEEKDFMAWANQGIEPKAEE